MIARSSLLYFAYGSNMCSRRLLARVAAARLVGKACLAGHEVRFHKRGGDGSGKADCVARADAAGLAWGVVYEMTAGAKRVLDGFEGLGRHYMERVVTPVIDGVAVEAITYVACADTIAPGLAPYTWYHAHIVRGAREHALPDDYVRRLEAVAAWNDPDAARHQREMSIATR